MKNRNILADIKGFLNENFIMTLATCDSVPWVATVYYGISDDLILYIVTDPNSKHGKLIKKNPRVAFNIFDSHTKAPDKKRGIQAQGECALVKNPIEVLKGLSLWHKANPGADTKITIDLIKKSLDTRIYKIVPTFIKFFNKELYGEEAYGIWKK